jgi:sulfur relay (sulfurtransferase) DsrC/TusE family protein
MKEVRKYAAKKLNDLTDEEWNFILLQLVQALRYEDFSVSPLRKTLIDKCS